MVAAAIAAVPGDPLLPGLQPDGSTLLPNQWSLRPQGRQLSAGVFPVLAALHPGGRFAAVITTGWAAHQVSIYDLSNPAATGPFSQVTLEEGGPGLAWSPDGRTLYASGGHLECIHVFAFADGYLSGRRAFQLRDPREQGLPASLAVSPDGRALYVTESWGQRIEQVDTRSGRIAWTRQLAPPEGRSGVFPEAPPAGAGPDAAPFPFAAIPDPHAPRVYVSLWGAATVLVLDSRDGREVARWAVGPHPNEMVLAADGRLFVAEANRNTVSVLATRTGQVQETLSASLYPQAPPGSTPDSLALGPGDAELYVANARNNNLAIFDVSSPGHATARGFIPVGWYPTCVRVAGAGRQLVVTNGKGISSTPNPGGPFPGDVRSRNVSQYVARLLTGTVSLLDLPAAAERPAGFARWTRLAYACSPGNAAGEPRGAGGGGPIPSRLGDPSPIRHVIYIVRENRTYDQVFGDVAEGNGEPQLCLFPEAVTPNAHALAREFVLLDNFFADGDVSADGHEWTLGAYATDFVERHWPLNYGHDTAQKYDYPSEGRYPIAYPEAGYLWNRASEAKVTFRTYGEFTHDGKGTPAAPAKPSLPVLRGHVDPLYPSWDTDIPDQRRADRFIGELHAFEAAGEMPALQVVQLPADHTVGTKAGAATPTAMVADNDLALGRIVDAVSHSKFWPDVVILVLEDDAQNGPDHVDAHRMPALVISPWTKRHFVDSSLYSTTSALRTIELILGLAPMSQFDAAALPLWQSFQGLPMLAPFSARPARVDLAAKNTAATWGARSSGQMDFSAPDRINDLALNEIVWRSVRGPSAAMPAPVRGAFFKARPKGAGDDDDDH